MGELRVARSTFTAEVEARRVRDGADPVCVVRIRERYFALADRCSHADVALSEGEVDPDECWIECWKHGSAFSLADGEPQSLPATAAVAVYPTSIDGEDIVVTVP